jgi:hypothetical protein
MLSGCPVKYEKDSQQGCYFLKAPNIVYIFVIIPRTFILILSLLVTVNDKSISLLGIILSSNALTSSKPSDL